MQINYFPFLYIILLFIKYLEQREFEYLYTKYEHKINQVIMFLNYKDGVNDIKREEINLIRGNEDGWSIIPCFRRVLNFGWIKSSGMFLIRTHIVVPIENIFGFIIGSFALHGTQSKTLDIAYIVGTLVVFIAFGLMEVLERDFKIQNEFKEKFRKK